MRANVIVPPPTSTVSTTVKRKGRRMSPVNNPALNNNMQRTAPKPIPSKTVQDINSILKDANTVLENVYRDQDTVFVRILNGYGQRVYVLVDQRGISVDNKMYQKDCFIEKNVLYTVKSFESYAMLCEDNDMGCAVEHEDKIYISLHGNTYLIHTRDRVTVPIYYPATGIAKIQTPTIFNSVTSNIYSKMRTRDCESIASIIDNAYSCSDSICNTVDDIGKMHSTIIEKLFNRMNKDIESRDRLLSSGDRSKYLEKVASLKQNNERVIDVNTIADISSIQADLDNIKARLNEVLDGLSDYMKQI